MRMRTLTFWGALTLLTAAPPLTAQAHTAAETLRLSLEDATARALAGATEVRMAEARVAEAGAQVRSSRAAWLPSLDASLQFRWQPTAESVGGAPTYAPDPSAPLEQRVRYLEVAAPIAPFSVLDPQLLFSAQEYGWVAGVSGEQVLFSGGRIPASVAAAKAQREAADAAAEAARARMRIDVAAAYREALLAGEQLTAAQTAQETAEFALEQARRRLEQDVGSELELLRAEADAAAFESRVAEAVEAQRMARERLGIYAQISPGLPLELTTTLGDPALAALTDAEPTAVLEKAQMAAIRGAEASVKAAEAAVRSVRAQARPSLVVQAGFQYYRAPKNPFELEGRWENMGTLSAMFKVPLLVPGRRGEEEAARARMEQARIEAREVREGASLESASVRAERERALAAWRSGRRRLEAARRSAELTEEALERGVATEVELAQARLEVVEAEADTARALVEYLSADAAGHVIGSKTQ